MKLSTAIRILILTVLAGGIILSSVSCTQALNLLRKLRNTSATSGQLEVPVNTTNAGNVGSLEFELVYDPSLLKVESVEKGKLADNAMIDFSIARPGRVWVAMVDSTGLNGSGSLAVISFSRIGKEQTSSALTLENVYAYDATSLIDIVTKSNQGSLTTPPTINFTR